jgi:hypothetical protein
MAERVSNVMSILKTKKSEPNGDTKAVTAKPIIVNSSANFQPFNGLDKMNKMAKKDIKAASVAPVPEWSSETAFAATTATPAMAPAGTANERTRRNSPGT